MFRTACLSLGVAAVAATTVVPVAMLSGDLPVAVVYTVGALLYGGVAHAARRRPEGSERPSSSTQLAMVALSWVVVAAGCAVLTWTAAITGSDAGDGSPLRHALPALFESTSGVSTTGLTMLSDPSTAAPW
jgi:Trk-type K+ transport system membrane component